MNKKNDAPETPDTGHEWDGIREFDNPLPRWWLWTFYATIIWGIAYTIAMPAWPILGDRATPGLLGYSSRAEVEAEIQKYKDANAAIDAKLVAAPLEAMTTDPELKNYAMNGGAAVYKTWCAQCHGSGANGAKGFPSLIDDDWLWGGSIEDIYTTIKHGIRSTDDEETRDSEMPAWDEILSEEELAAVVQHVLRISGQPADEALAEKGATVFADNCASCHGDDGKGMRELGAPNLTDAIWLYGGDAEAIAESVRKGRRGVMPAWAGRLSETQIRQVATWVHQQGGGE